ncbi:unnamed protein product [Aspergillus oryzae var. brunneus]|uniref:Unnamed protein product n=1 Tax=Aspergillus oryzae var. brunneus TaxID=332754 RepID=A0ABQ6KX78_ASPOZ|nr:unnamed protein product [Aspergillus oryzae var. brunneus]
MGRSQQQQTPPLTTKTTKTTTSPPTTTTTTAPSPPPSPATAIKVNAVEQSRTESAEIGEKSSSRKGYQKSMSSGVEEKSSLRPVPKTTAAGGKTLGGKKNKKAKAPSDQRSILSFMGPAHEAGETSEPLQTSHRPGPQTTAAGGKIRGGKKGKKASVPSNQGSILSFMGPAEEAGQTSEPLQTGCITAGKRPPTEAVAENASESKRAKIIKEEPVVSVKAEEELEDTLYDIKEEEEEEVPFNPEDYADVILIEDEEYPDELKYEDAAGHDVEENDLSEQVSQEAGYFEEEGFISDADRYQTAGIADEDHEALQESFDKSMHRVIRYLFGYAQRTPFKELSSNDSYIAKGMYNWLRRADPEVVYRLYQAIIPVSTRTILGHDRLTCQHILALPKVSPSRREKGVYLDLVTSPSDNGGLYTGSTKKSFVVRIPAHKYQIQRNGSVKGTHYMYIREKTNRKPNFRVVAVFPRDMPELGIENANSEWLIRFLEAVIMIVLDTFTPGSISRFSITQDRLNHLKFECDLRDTIFESLNHALPTKQPVESNLPKVYGDGTQMTVFGFYAMLAKIIREYTALTGLPQLLISYLHQPQGHAATQIVVSKYQGVGNGTQMTVFGFYAMLVTDTRAAVMAMRGHWRLFSSAKRTNAAVYVAIVQMAQTSGGTQHVINQLLGCTGALPVTRGIKGACQKLQIRLPNLHYASAAVNQILKTGT